MILVLLLACAYDTSEDIVNEVGCPEANISYRQDVVPILQASNCITCHDGINQQGGIILDTYDNVKVLAENGGLMGSVRHEDGFSAMPQGADQLSDCNIQILQVWIDEGIQNN